MSRHLSRLQAMVLGIAVVVGLGLGIHFLFVIAQRRGLDGTAFTVRAGFRDVGGVGVGARVRIQGIDAGEVEAVETPAAPGEAVTLKLRVSGKMRHLVRSDAVVQIASESLLAGKIVRIVPGKSNGEPVAEGALLASAPYEDLGDTMAQAAAKLHRVLGDLDVTLTEFRSGQGTAGEITRELSQATVRLNTVLNKVDVTLEGVQKGEGTLGQLVKNDGLYKELNGALYEVRGALQDMRSGEGTLGKVLKSNEVYAEALQSIHDVRKMVASVKQNSDAIKSLPVVRNYVIDAHKELVRPDKKRERRWLAEAQLFQPGKAILTEEGKGVLDRTAAWLNESKDASQELVIAAFASADQNPEFAQTLTTKQSEAVLDYLKANHSVHRVGFWFWSNRTARAVGVGSSPPPTFESSESLPANRVELIVFSAE